MQLKVKLLHGDARVPEQAYPGTSAGYDLFPVEVGVIAPGDKKNIGLGFATEFDAGYVAVIDDRGGVGNKCLTHFAGVVDSDYRDEWQLIMYNAGKTPYEYGPAKALAQFLLLPHESPKAQVVEILAPSLRDKGKFGSTDKA